MNLFFIESPLQALNAIEFVSCKDNKQGKDLFIILSDGTMSETNLAQIEFVLNFFGYDDKVIFNINGGVKSLFLHREQVRMLAKRYSKYNIEYCVIGEYRSLASRVLINKIKPKKVVTVDDGTATLRIERSKKPSVKIRLITTLCKFGLGFDITLKQGVHFFSVYDISNKLTKGDCLHTNRYSFLKSKLYDYPKSNKHFIIGSPLKEAGVVKEDIILTIKKIDKIVSLTKSKKSDLVYIAHRR
ncbi:hypothetical protein, partial [Salinivibrio sp. MA607]|uniref:hypothetical protein n=1 Tax=Salinivibrio sp. MA607 TaxID=1909457 RepID=UPI0009895CB4